MAKVDRYPSTPVKLIVAQVMTVVFFGFSIHWIEHNVPINETVFYVLAGAVFGSDLNAVLQYKFKRQTAWKDGESTKSENALPARSGQPAVPANRTAPSRPLTSAEAEEAE